MPAFYSYSGLCKHCVAVLLDYIEEGKEQRMRPRAFCGSCGARPRTSTYGFDGILNQYVYRDKVNLMQPDILGGGAAGAVFLSACGKHEGGI